MSGSRSNTGITQMRRISRFSLVIAIVAAVTVLFSGLAVADVVDNNVDVSGVRQIASGSSTAIVYQLTAVNQDGGPNGQGNCNASSSNRVTVAINLPSGNKVTAKNAAGNNVTQLSFSDCGSAHSQTVNFSSSNLGLHAITHTVSGGQGTLTNSADFTLAVVAADITPPVITKTVTGTAGTNGWYTSDVSVAWTVTDNESPATLTSGCGTQQFTTETAAATSSCSATSAGGSSSDSVALKIDKTAPTGVALAPSGTAGQNGWYTSNVSVLTSGSETLSGLTCTDAQSFTNETVGQNVNGSCTNGAGLTTPAAPLSVKIDKSGPTAGLAITDGVAGSNGWYTSNVTVDASGTDGISGPVTCSPASQTLQNNTAGTTLSAACTNRAGLSTNASPLTVKIDKSNPTASLSVAHGTLSNGWYTDDVTVRTAGADDDSGIGNCTADQYLTSDTSPSGQEFNGACTNNAGVTQNAAALTIKRDASAPTAKLVVTEGTPGANGWYTSGVTVAVQGEDSQSGVECSRATVLTAETGGTQVTGYCVNGAGALTEAAPLTIKIDKTGPSAELAAAGTRGANGWFVDNVEVATSGADALSGPVTCTAPQSQTAETAGEEFNGSCTNEAGLLTNAATLTVKLDKTGPSASAAITNAPARGANGWYTSDIAAATTGSDSISNPVTCTKDVVLQTEETAGTDVAGRCTNDAGLSTDAASLTVKLDKTAPTASIDATGTRGNDGWFVSDVALKTTGNDPMSGVVGCTADQAQTTDTTGTTFYGSCTNGAGLTSISDSVAVKRDATKAVIVDARPTNEPNSKGWYNASVTNVFTATDATSGLAEGTSPINKTSGSQQGRAITLASGDVSDIAGNRADSIDSAPFKIDLSAPTVGNGIVTAGNEGTNGWYTTDVTVGYTATDNLSGFGTEESLTTTSQVLSSGQGNINVDSPPFTDNADNTVAAADKSRSFKVDKDGPSVSYTSATAGSGNGPSTDGWFKAPVTATFTGTDGVSGFDADAAETDTKTGSSPAGVEGAAVQIQSPAFTDYAGNTTAANAASQSFKIDLTKPTNVAFTGDGVQDGSSYYFGQVPAAPTGCSAEDALSGVKGCAVTGNYSTAVGQHTLTATATDKAGNTETATLTYTVLAWSTKGFFSPINMSSSTMKVWNTAKGGSTIPAKFEVFAGNTELTDPAVAGMGYRRVSCQTGDVVTDEIEQVITSTNQLGLRYDSTAGQFIYNWKTPTVSSTTCYELKATLDDGGAITALFSLRK